MVVYAHLEVFLTNFEMLVIRYKEFEKINCMCNNGKLNIHDKEIHVRLLTYLDIILVQLRAMCIENKNLKNNFTLQNILIELGEEGLAGEVDKMLDEPFLFLPWEEGGKRTENMSIKSSIKFLSDKFICHYDYFDKYKDFDPSRAGLIEVKLRNPYEKVNLDYIINKIIAIVEQGLSLHREKRVPSKNLSCPSPGPKDV